MLGQFGEQGFKYIGQYPPLFTPLGTLEFILQWGDFWGNSGRINKGIDKSIGTTSMSWFQK